MTEVSDLRTEAIKCRIFAAMEIDLEVQLLLIAFANGYDERASEIERPASKKNLRVFHA